MIVSEKNLDLESAFMEAKNNNSDYLIDIKINNWKDSSYFLCAPSNNQCVFQGQKNL